jgi:hypothetical protein
MWDVIVLGIVIGFFVLAIAYVLSCEWLNPSARGVEDRK